MKVVRRRKQANDKPKTNSKDGASKKRRKAKVKGRSRRKVKIKIKSESKRKGNNTLLFFNISLSIYCFRITVFDGI